MNTHRQPRYKYTVTIGLSIALAAASIYLLSQAIRSARAVSAQPLATGASYVVSSTADLPDADQGDHLCLALNGKCTLRAAIMQANFATGLDTITLPSGVFVLTRPGGDDEAVLGDLDILDDVTIQGPAPAQPSSTATAQ